jgi:hypothetical protein
MLTTCILELAKALGLPAVAVAVSFLGYMIARWQLRIAKEKLRHDLYDRRFGIYMAFHELLLAIVEKDDVETELRKANAARAHSPFLLDEQLGAYLIGLYEEAWRINNTVKLIRNESLWSPAERASRAAQLGQDKLTLVNRIGELTKEFERFLRLQDFNRSIGSLKSCLYELRSQGRR